jgi:CBS domain-containing protein
MKIQAIMSSPVITVSADAKLHEAAAVMLENGIGCLPVLDGQGGLLGLITKRTFIAREEGMAFSTIRAPRLFGHWLKEGVESIYELAREISVRDVAIRAPVTLLEDDLVKTFLERVLTNGITHAPILRDRVLVGIVSQQDLLKIMVTSTANGRRDFEETI